MGGNTGRRTKSERMDTRHRSAHFGEALAYANELHAGQTRKGTPIPYISHLLAVASLAFEYGADEDEAIAALLHDAVEDQGGLRPCSRSTAGSAAQSPPSWTVARTPTWSPNPRGGTAKRHISNDSPGNPQRSGSCRPVTSCTTCAPSSATIASTATGSGNGSTVAKTVRSGTTVRW